MGAEQCCCKTALSQKSGNNVYVWQKTLKFINGDAASVHGAIRVSSIFTSESGEWKLGGLDVLSSMKEDDAAIYVGYITRIETSTC